MYACINEWKEDLLIGAGKLTILLHQYLRKRIIPCTYGPGSCVSIRCKQKFLELENKVLADKDPDYTELFAIDTSDKITWD